jgi:hypothetical protein
MARAGLPEAKSPVDASRHPPERRLNRCRALRRCRGFAGATFGVRAMPSEGIQGDELAAYVPLDTYGRDERGIAYGTRVLWRRRSGSSRRSHDLPRRTGKPSTGRSRPGDRTPQRREVGVMPNAETVLGVQRGVWVGPPGCGVMITGEPVAGKSGTAGSGRGPLEKDLVRVPRQRPTGAAHCLGRRAFSVDADLGRRFRRWPGASPTAKR